MSAINIVWSDSMAAWCYATIKTFSGGMISRVNIVKYPLNAPEKYLEKAPLAPTPLLCLLYTL